MANIKNMIKALKEETTPLAITPTVLGEVLDEMANESSENSRAASKILTQIYPEIMNGVLYLRGVKNVDKSKFIPFIFRWTEHQQHWLRRATETFVYGHKLRGWRVFYGAEKVVVADDGRVDFVKGNPKDGVEDLGPYAKLLFQKAVPHYDDEGELIHYTVPFGSRRLVMKKMRRVKFAIGFAPSNAKPNNKPFDMSLMATNLAVFKVLVTVDDEGEIITHFSL